MWLTPRYKCILFDLDRTLWDFESNASETLNELYVKHGLNAFIVDCQTFIQAYSVHNQRLWAEYTSGNLKKEELRRLRFYLTLKQFGVDNRELGARLDTEYINICPKKTALFPYTKPILEYLSTKKYRLYIVTNGFVEAQTVKLLNSGIHSYFEAVITSEEVGFPKPDPRIFQHILSIAKVSPKQCIMVGDDWQADICGAKNAGMAQVFFNPYKKEHNGKPTYEIASLNELKSIL